MRVELKNITKKFGAHVALENISLLIKEGELTSLLGPSGCGKTTLLRIISGLETPNGGSVSINNKDITHSNITARKIGFVFQHYALFQHMSVFDNVAFGISVKTRKEKRMEGLTKEVIAQRVHEVLSLVQLDNQSRKYPDQLSGGQQQRVALARVLVIRPSILLLDEPFGALDATVRRDLRRWLRRLHDEIHLTTVLVTHDQEEALEISDKVALLNQGKLEQVGHPREIYTSPANSFVYEFLGVVNVFKGRLKNHQLIHFTLEKKEEFIKNPQSEMYVRPHEVEVFPERKNLTDKFKNALKGTIIRVSFVATTVILEIRVDDDEDNTKTEDTIVEATLSDSEWELYKFKTGDKVRVRAKNITTF